MATDSESGLEGFIESVMGPEYLRVEETLGNGYVRLRISEAERRQAKHDIRCVEDIVIEILRNARDAGAHAIYLATSRDANMRTITCLDDGSGIPQHMQDRVFDARVTSKLDSMCMDRWGVHGRGMALYSIRQNVKRAYVAVSEPQKGTSIVTEIDCAMLPERADQSTFPRISSLKTKAPEVRGPRNIVRYAVEFALDVRPSVDVYLGNATEILCALYAGSAHEGFPRESVLGLPARAHDAHELCAIAQGLGLAVSERTCYRIMKGELEPPRSLVQMAKDAQRGVQGEHEIDLERDRRSLRLSSEDEEDFVENLCHAFEGLGERYYLTLKSNPTVRVSNDTITVTYTVEKQS